jgi:importin subunit alpha-1
MIDGLIGQNKDEQLKSVTKFRKLLSTNNNKIPIDEVIESGAVPRIIELMQKNKDTYFLIESTWVLTNIASGSLAQSKCIIESDGIPILIELLNSTSEELQDQAVWAFANLAGNNSEIRDLIINNNIISPLMKY